MIRQLHIKGTCCRILLLEAEIDRECHGCPVKLDETDRFAAALALERLDIGGRHLLL
jgi:hypothetical protein